MRTLESEIASPYVINEIKPYLKLGDLDQAVTNAVCRPAGVERDRKENFAREQLAEVSGCKVYPVTERCVEPAVVVTHSVLIENSKSGITQDFLHCYKYVNRSKVYDGCKYHDSNIIDS